MNHKSIPFLKYHGTGNDFIIIDELNERHVDESDDQLLASMCHRRFGIGADGVMLIRKSDQKNVDFRMLYYNSDGHPSSMCGNGGRCISAAFLHLTKSDKDYVNFSFGDDTYTASLIREMQWLELRMNDVEKVEITSEDYVLDTGSPHYVDFSSEVSLKDVKQEGSIIRNSNRFKKHGINVNFCQWTDSRLLVRTYERGVEDETYSCGTGVVASSIAWSIEQDLPNGEITIPIQTLGGQLAVSFTKKDTSFTEIVLRGPAQRVFEGSYRATE